MRSRGDGKLGEVVEAVIVVEDPGVVALGFEFVAGGLGGHLADDGEDAAFDAWDQMANVGIGAVDHVFSFDCSSWCDDFVVFIASPDLRYSGVCLEAEACRELFSQMSEKSSDEFVGPHGARNAGYCTSSIWNSELLYRG